MDWDDLRFAVMLGREGTLAGAARRLGVDQTTVARRLRALETALGANLFQRGDRHWQPTAAGLLVLERAERIEEEIAGVVRLAEAGADKVEGVVRLTAVAAIGGAWLVSRLPALYQRHPGLCVELIASNDNLNVARREADIAVRVARPVSGDLLIRKLADVGFARYGTARENLPVGAGDWVAYNEELAHTPEMHYLQTELGDGRVRLRSNSVNALIQAVADGVGQGVLPCFLADPAPDLVRLSGPAPVLSRELWLVLHPDARAQARVVATAEWLVECFRAEATRFAGQPVFGGELCV